MKQSSDNAQRKTDLLVVGAGPFGLAMAAYARHLGIEHLIVGKPMGFWKANMPKGMYLRSACDWHLDPLDIDTIEKFVATKGLSTKDVEPLSLEFYLSYARWFQEQKQISVLPTLVRKLDEHFQSSVPGMFITSLPAVQQFGPFFAFTIAVRASAKLIGQAISARADSRAGPPLMRRHDQLAGPSAFAVIGFQSPQIVRTARRYVVCLSASTSRRLYPNLLRMVLFLSLNSERVANSRPND